MLDENLISTLEDSLRQTRRALQRLTARRDEIRKHPDTSQELLERFEAEISTLKNSAETTEQAISSLLHRMKSDGIDRFGLEGRMN